MKIFIYVLIGFFSVSFLKMCKNDRKSKPDFVKDSILIDMSHDQPEVDTSYLIHSQINLQVAQDMVASFYSNSKKRIESIISSQETSYSVSANNYTSMMTDFINQANSDTLYFIPIQPKEVTELSKYDNQLYMLYTFGKNMSNATNFDVYSIEPADGNFYAFCGTQSIVKLDKITAHKYIKNYQTNLKPILKPKKNTNYIKIYKDEMVAYDSIWNSLSTQPDEVIINWAETLSQSSLGGIALPTNKKNSTINRYFNAREGAITFTTDAYERGQLITELSNFDMNTLCPDNCP